MSVDFSGGAAFVHGDIVYNDLMSVMNYYNTNYPGFNMNYNVTVNPLDDVTTGYINGFLRAMGDANFGWKGATARPDKLVYNDRDDIVEIRFRVPQSNFDPIWNREFFVSDNGTDKNTFEVPPGCQYMFVSWIVAGGGGGGGAGKLSPHVQPGGGGAGAYVQSLWFRVRYQDKIIVTIGDKGRGVTTRDGTGGGDSKIALYRPSTNTQTDLIVVTGGNGGPNAWNTRGYSEGSGGTTAGGHVTKTYGYTGYRGADGGYSQVFEDIKHVGSDGSNGGWSPYGTLGRGKPNNQDGESATGYGAGGGGTGFYQGKHYSGDSDPHRGGDGAPGHAVISFTAYGPNDGSPVFDLDSPANSISLESVDYNNPSQRTSVGGGDFYFKIPQNIRYIGFPYGAGGGGQSNRWTPGRSGAYILNSYLGLRDGGDRILHVSAAPASSSGGPLIVTLDTQVLYNLSGGQPYNGANGNVISTVDPRHSFNGWGNTNNTGGINTRYGFGGTRGGKGDPAGLYFSTYTDRSQLPGGADPVSL